MDAGSLLRTKITIMAAMNVASKDIHVSLSKGNTNFSKDVSKFPGGTRSCGLNIRKVYYFKPWGFNFKS